MDAARPASDERTADRDNAYARTLRERDVLVARVADLEEMLRAAREAATTQYEEARAAEAQVAALTQERENYATALGQIMRIDVRDVDETKESLRTILADCHRIATNALTTGVVAPDLRVRAEAAEAALANTRQALADLLENGGWGHSHWDSTGQHGAGCETCKTQRQARDKARRALAAGDNTTEPA